MAKPAILPLKNTNIEIDIFSNKSALVLFWLMTHSTFYQKEGFSVNEIARHINVSLGQVHKVIKQLEFVGIIESKGLRTNKKFYFKKPGQLLTSWIHQYNLIRKTKTKGFAGFSNQIDSSGKLTLVPALHTAASKIFNLKVTNLRQKEFYILNWEQIPMLMKEFDLTELDRGYEILFIKPYYSALLEKYQADKDNMVWRDAIELLTILDLVHFPIRGIEQAEVLFKNSRLKQTCSWKDIENGVG